MKRIYVEQYGSVDVLQETDVPVPSPGARQVVVRTAAVGVNDPDVHIRAHGPFPTMPEHMRPTLPHMLGEDFSGVVTAIGDEVTRFAPGDHVVGLTLSGTYADHLVLDEDAAMSVVPTGLDLVPLGGFYLSAATAWSAVVTNGWVQPGQTVLVHGAAGGVGGTAVQLARHYGAHVIGTAGGYSRDHVLALGAQEVVDYRTQDFTALVHDVDLVVNTTGQETLDRSYQVVRPGGRLVSVNGMPDPSVAREHGIEIAYAMGDLSADARGRLLQLYAAGELGVEVSRLYPFTLDAVKQSHLDYEAGPNQGKRIITFPGAA